MTRALPRTMLAVVMILGTSLVAGGQIFRLQAGTSTLFNADGGAVQFKAPNYDGQVGVGFMDDKFRLGASFRTRIMGNTVTAGDETVRFDLPTDVFDSSHYFLARGLGVLHPYALGNVYAFVGTTSEGFITPFFSAASSADRVGVLYFDRKLSPRFRFYSRNVISRRKSSIQAVEWSPERGLKISGAAGMGSNQGYGAAGVDVDRQNFKLKAAYIAAGKQFERIRTPLPLAAETERENISIAYRPSKAISFSASHQNIVQPPYQGQDFIHAAVNELSSTVSRAKFSFGGGLYHSRIAGNSNTGTNLFVSRELTRRLSVSGNLFQSRADVGPASKIYMAGSRFTLNSRLTVSGLVSRSDHQTSFGVGGELTSNRLSLGVNSQMVYVPLNLERPFQQAIGVNASAYLFGDLRATIASFVTPDGKVRYTFGFSRFFYRQQGLAMGPSGPSYQFAKYVLSGVVTDERDNPIEGAAVHVGKQVAYSDRRGEFMVRLDKRGPYAILVAADEFIAPGFYETLSAPSIAAAQPEDAATPIRIVLRRVVK